ncbi:hypothetical protein AAFF_G00017500 [Aldrovandia affinis]|uniref:phospholipase D n=1 Tax=Aldrovandia affinis TaxID=143900 RepID=A0AAD7S5T4_9TELE|nr:hypothetical protein AAFF_G00017500 [Aldrovandia affinis]
MSGDKKRGSFQITSVTLDFDRASAESSQKAFPDYTDGPPQQQQQQPAGNPFTIGGQSRARSPSLNTELPSTVPNVCPSTIGSKRVAVVVGEPVDSLEPLPGPPPSCNGNVAAGLVGRGEGSCGGPAPLNLSRTVQYQISSSQSGTPLSLRKQVPLEQGGAHCWLPCSSPQSPSRFRVVRLGQGLGEPYCRGRWTCTDFLERDGLDKGGLWRVMESMHHAHFMDSLEMAGLGVSEGEGPALGSLAHIHALNTGHLVNLQGTMGILAPSVGSESRQHQQDSFPFLSLPRRSGRILPAMHLDLNIKPESLVSPLKQDRSFHHDVGPNHTPSAFSLAQSMFGVGGAFDLDSESGSSKSMMAIDSKIEQAMDLVKTHLMLAVREEVELLREQIAELTERNTQLERENYILPERTLQIFCSTMACVDEGVLEATHDPGLMRRRYSRDNSPLSQDELDGFTQNSEERPFLLLHRLQAAKEWGMPLLLQGAVVSCRVESTERYTTRSKVRACTLYTIRLTHGQFSWTVKRRYKHFQELHRDLYKHRMMLHFLPLGRFAIQRQQLAAMTEEMPSLHSGVRRTSSKPKYLEEYLNGLLENSFCKNYHGMLEFLDVSPLSFIKDLGPKGLEGFILKRSGGHRIQGLNCIGHHQFCFRWSHRWLVVKDSFLLYMNREAGVISFVLLFDPELKVLVGRCYTDTKHGVCIQNFTRTLIIKCSSYKQAQWWSHEIRSLAEPSDFFQTHRFQGFTPPREATLTKWYVNGSGYFADVALALDQAKEEIFITDWWLSPEVHLKRPATDTYWRLDQILKRKAEQGVKVCVLLYKEVELALGINSDYSKRTLMNLHPNIKVMRHPDHVSSIIFLWAHHEKMVAIDQSVTFIGGIDLAFGRWDDSLYRLTDLAGLKLPNHYPEAGSEAIDTDDQGSSGPMCQPTTAMPEPVDPADLTGNSLLWLGKDYSNFINKDWVHLDHPFEDNIDRSQVPRMPWRDLAAVVHGKAARDVARHFIQRWNFTKVFKNKYKDNFFPCLLPKSHTTADSLPFTVPGAVHASVQVLRSVDRWSAGTCESSIHNAYIHTIENSQHYIYIENQFFISCADGRSVHNGIGDAIVKRILRAHSEQRKYRVYVVVPLLPGFEGDITTGGGNAIQAILHFTYRTMCRGEFSILTRLKEHMQDQWMQYISLCGLRTHSELSQFPVTELIYVHSKTLIADDRCYIIGSANINDRSMLGNRDSELAVFVQDEERVLSRMGGEEYQAGPLTLALRMECFRVLLGVGSESSIDIQDPISDVFFQEVWNKAARSNANIYDMVFRCLPSNSIRSLRALREMSSMERLCETDPERARKELEAVSGLLVHFPLNFLCEECLLPPISSKERMIPLDVWT